MTRKPPELPDIDDAALRAYLAPLMDSMPGQDEDRPVRTGVVVPLPRARPTSNDNPPPVPEDVPPQDTRPPALAAWRAMADDDYGTFRTIESFLARSDQDLAAAAASFPKQLGATLARLTRLRERLLAQADLVAEAQVLLRRALARAATGDVAPGE